MSEMTAQGGAMMVDGQQFLPSTWADQVYWPGTTKTVVDVVATKAEAATERARVDKHKRPNDIRTYPVKSGQTIHAGDVVDVVGGEAGKTWRAEANVETVFRGATVTSTATERLSDLYSVAASGASNATAVRVVLLDNISGKTLSFVDITTAETATNVSLACRNNTQFAMGCIVSGNLTARVETLDGTTITNGGMYTLAAGAGSGNLLDLGDNQLFAVYNRSGLKAKVFPVTDTVINTTGTMEAPLPGNTSAVYLSLSRLPDLNSNKRVCVCFTDAGDGSKGKAAIATITPDNTVEWGSAVTFEGLSIASYQISCKPSDTDIVVAYAIFDGSNYYIRAKILLANGSVLQDNDPITISKGSWVVLGKLGEALNISYDASSIGKSAQLKRYGNTLFPGEEYTFKKQTGSNPTVKYLSADAIASNRLLLAYSDASNSNYGTSTILEVRGDQIAGSFTDASADCIALQNATSGQPCEVIFDGVAELPGALAGTEINSPGVYGYCPEEGRVWVRPEWDGGIVTGSYVGNGSTIQNKITLGFRPKAVMIAGKSSGDSDQNNHMAFLVGKSNIGSGSGFSITDDGFSVKTLSGNYPPRVNAPGETYDFIAFK